MIQPSCKIFLTNVNISGIWRNELLNEILGQVNKEAAQQYKERIKDIVRSESTPLARFGYTTKRRICGIAWTGLHFIITKICGDVRPE